MLLLEGRRGSIDTGGEVGFLNFYSGFLDRGYKHFALCRFYIYDVAMANLPLDEIVGKVATAKKQPRW